MSTKNTKSGEQFLKLCSPSGAPPITYKWPLIKNENVNEATEIVDTIEWVARDFHDVHYAVDTFILNELDMNSFASMKQLCDKYNKAITNIRRLWSGRQPPSCLGSPPNPALLKHIMTQVYNHAIDNAGLLNHYEPFSPEVYGETSYDLVEQVVKEANVTENDVFLDLGSGVGNVVLQVAGAAMPKECIGIEKADKPAKYAESMERHFIKWMKWYGKTCGDFELIKGDFFSPEFATIISKATIIFVNNFAFGPKVNHQLKLKFQNLSDGVRIVSSAEFCSLNFRINDRNLSDIGAMMDVHLLSPLKGRVSWTHKPVNFYLQIIDRTLLEKYFYYKNHPDEEPPEELRRKLYPKEAQDLLGGDEGSDDKVSSEGQSSTPTVPKQSKLSVASKNQLLQEFSERLVQQISSFMTRMSSAPQQPKLKQQIRKEKMRREHLKAVVKSLEDEVKLLQTSSATNMESCMDRLNLVPHTPEGLMKGEKWITNKNRKLKRDVNKLEADILSLKQELDTRYRMMQKNGIQLPQDPLDPSRRVGSSDERLRDVLFEPNSLLTADNHTANHSRSSINGLEQLLRVSELELLRSGEANTHENRSSVTSSVNSPSQEDPPHCEPSPLFQRTEQSRDEVLAAETLSSLASIGSGTIHQKPQSLKGKEASKSVSSNPDNLNARKRSNSRTSTSSHLPSFVLAGTSSPSHCSRRSPWRVGMNSIRVPDHNILGEGEEAEDRYSLAIEKVDTGAKQTSILQQKASSKHIAAPPVYLPDVGTLRNVAVSTNNSSPQSSDSPTLPLASTLPKATPMATVSPHPQVLSPTMIVVPPSGSTPLEGGGFGSVFPSKSPSGGGIVSWKPIDSTAQPFSQSGRKRHSPDSRLGSTSSRKTTTNGSAAEERVDSPTPSTPVSEPVNPMMMGSGAPAILPPFWPALIPMVSMSKNGPGPMYSMITSSSNSTSAFSATTSSTTATSSYPGLLYAPNGQPMQSSKMFSALDLQQPTPSPSGAQKPQMLPLFPPMMPYPGFGTSPTSVSPGSGMLLPSPLLMPAQFNPATSTTGPGPNWVMPGTLPSNPPFPFQPLPFQMMGLPSPQQLAMMKALNSGSKDTSSGNTTPPAQNRVVLGNPQLQSQDVGANSSLAQTPTLFSPTFHGGMPPMMPSPLLMGTLATPNSQPMQPSSSGSSGGIPSSGSGQTKEGQPKRKYQRRRPKQQQQQNVNTTSEDLTQISTEGLAKLVSITQGSESALGKPSEKKQTGSQRKTSKKNKGRSSELQQHESSSLSPVAVSEHTSNPTRTQAVVSNTNTGKHSVHTPSPTGEDEGKKRSLEASNMDVQECVSEMDKNQPTLVNTASGTSTDVSSVDTGFTSGHDDTDALTVHADSCPELSKTQEKRDGSKTCSPTSLADASTLLSLRQAFTFQGQVVNNDHSETSQSVSQTTADLSIPSDTGNTRSDEQSRKGRNSSISVAEAMLMLNSGGDVDSKATPSKEDKDDTHCTSLGGQNVLVSHHSPSVQLASNSTASLRNETGSSQQLEDSDGVNESGIRTNLPTNSPPCHSTMSPPCHRDSTSRGHSEATRDQVVAEENEKLGSLPGKNGAVRTSTVGGGSWIEKAQQDSDASAKTRPDSPMDVSPGGPCYRDLEEVVSDKSVGSMNDVITSRAKVPQCQLFSAEISTSLSTSEELCVGTSERKDSGSLVSPSSLTSPASLVFTDTASKSIKDVSNEDFVGEEAEPVSKVAHHPDQVPPFLDREDVHERSVSSRVVSDADTTPSTQMNKEARGILVNTNDKRSNLSAMCSDKPEHNSEDTETDCEHVDGKTQDLSSAHSGSKSQKSLFRQRKLSNRSNYRRRQSEGEDCSRSERERRDHERNGNSCDHLHHDSNGPSSESECDNFKSISKGRHHSHHVNGHHHSYQRYEKWRHHGPYQSRDRDHGTYETADLNCRKRSLNFSSESEFDEDFPLHKRPSV